MAKPRLAWSEVKLGDVLQRIRKPVEVKLSTSYREIGIRSHGKGLFHKEARTGKSLGDKSVFWVEPDCFVVNIVFAWEQAVAKTTINESGMIASHRFPMYKPIPDKLDLDYLLYYFYSPRGKYLLGLASPGGAGRNKTLGQEAFHKLVIPLPPLSEQCRIAAILGTWDTAIALTEQLIAAKQRLKKGLMQMLLTGKKRFKEFYDKWDNLAINQIGEVVSGGTPDTGILDYWGGEIAWCTPSDITALSSVYISSTRKTITQSGLKDSSAKLIPPNSIMVCTRATIGDCAINTVPVTTSQGFKSLVPTNKHKAEYLYYLISLNKHQLLRVASGSTFLEVSKYDFEKIDFLLPSLNEQKRIAEVLLACDTELGLLTRKLAALRQQKKGLMQKLLTGEVRVKGS